jgi:hypothetical protein
VLPLRGAQGGTWVSECGNVVTIEGSKLGIAEAGDLRAHQCGDLLVLRLAIWSVSKPCTGPLPAWRTGRE